MLCRLCFLIFLSETDASKKHQQDDLDAWQGRIFVDPAMPGASPGSRRAAYSALARTLAALHSVDIASVGLESYGRPTGYCARQARHPCSFLDAERL